MKRMRLHRVALAIAFLFAGAGAASAGDVPGPPPGAMPLPGPLSPAADAPYFGVGLSAGPMWPSDLTLDAGLYAVGQLSFRFNRYAAVELDFGRAVFNDDYYGGDLEVRPVAGYVVLSLPLGPGYPGAEASSFRLAFGVGRLSSDHTFAEVEDEVFFALQTGAEWAIPARAKVFVVVDTMWADFVLGDRLVFDPGLGGPAIPFWDLEALTALRIGVEFAF